MSQTRSTGWQLTLTHPTTGRTFSPDVLDDPEFLPSLNALVEARIPVRRSQDLLEWPSGTTVSLSLNGQDQPLDEVVDISQESDRTILTAEGGIELDNRVRTEYQEKRRHIAAKEIITNNTSYTEDVDTPDFSEQDGVVQQNPDTTTEFQDLVTIADTSPAYIENGELKTHQTGFFFEAETIGNGTTVSNVDYSDGSGVTFDDLGDDISGNFSLGYTIPSGHARIEIRYVVGTGGEPEYRSKIDGNTVGESLSGGGPTSIEWQSEGALQQDLTAGNHTVSLEVEDVNSDGNAETGDAEVDAVFVYDDRFNYNFDNTVDSDNGHLDGPETHPNAVDVVFSDATSPFVILESTGTLAIDDTGNEQAVAISADQGSTYVEATNSTTVTATGLETPQVRLRVTLSRHSPNGPRNQSPRFGYASQKIDSFELTTGLRQESLLIDQTFDNSVASVLNQIAGDEYIWSYRLEDGTPTLSWTQPGQRTADSDPDIDASASVSKDIKTWDAVTIKGSAQTVSGEVFSGSTTLQELNRDNIVPGSEAVRNPTDNTQFTRSEDYEIQYNPGEIRILDSGDMSSGTDYEVDYRYEVEATYPEDYAGSNELVETISGVVSDRQAQQLAYIILEVDPGVAHPSWSADVLLPRGDGLFDPLEALSLEQLELPDAATPLEIREPPQETPRGIALRLGSGRGLDEALSSLSNQLTNVSRRS